MKTAERRIRIVIAAALQDAGEATRALEIARGIREYQPDGWNTSFFFSHMEPDLPTGLEMQVCAFTIVSPGCEASVS